MTLDPMDMNLEVVSTLYMSWLVALQSQRSTVYGLCSTVYNLQVNLLPTLSLFALVIWYEW